MATTPDELKARVLNKSPFFGAILFSMVIEEKPDMEAPMGTDGEKLYWNKEYWDLLGYREQLGVMVHEVVHCVLGHIWRQGGREGIAVDPKTGEQIPIWQLATDYAANLLVENVRGVKLHPGALYDEKYNEFSAEKIYNELKNGMKKMGGGGGGSQQQKKMQQMMEQASKKGNGSHKDWNSMSKDKSQKAAGKMKQKIRHATEYAKAKGDVPAGLERMFQELEPKENWRDLLINYAQPYQDDYTFNPNDRRFIEDDFVLPDIQDGEKIDWIAIAVDTSGSISKDQLDEFLGEIKGIMDAFDKVKVKITFCDADASEFLELDKWEPDMIKPTGGGGTSFVPPFKLVEKEDSQPLAMLYFTDMWGDFPSKAPAYDTIWISNSGEDKAPFGKVLDYEA